VSYATVTGAALETVEYGPLWFMPGERLRVVARAVAGEARSLYVDESSGLSFHTYHDTGIEFDDAAQRV
jgi:hypothetical protein